MDSHLHHNKTQRDLALLCARFDIVPKKDLALKNYSESAAKANMITSGNAFAFYKTGQMFDLPHGVTLNKEVKRQREQEKNQTLFLEAMQRIKSILKRQRSKSQVDGSASSKFLTTETQSSQLDDDLGLS